MKILIDKSTIKKNPKLKCSNCKRIFSLKEIKANQNFEGQSGTEFDVCPHCESIDTFENPNIKI